MASPANSRSSSPTRPLLASTQSFSDSRDRSRSRSPPPPPYTSSLIPSSELDLAAQLEFTLSPTSLISHTPHHVLLAMTGAQRNEPRSPRHEARRGRWIDEKQELSLSQSASPAPSIPAAIDIEAANSLLPHCTLATHQLRQRNTAMRAAASAMGLVAMGVGAWVVWTVGSSTWYALLDGSLAQAADGSAHANAGLW